MSNDEITPGITRHDYHSLKDLSKTLGRPVGTLIAQGPDADPFYAGLPMRELRARWFKEVWDRFNVQPGVHLRRLHYLLVSQPSPVRLPREVKGTWDYVNNNNCWVFLNDATSDARYLGLIPFEAIVDQRNAEAEVNYDPIEEGADLYVTSPQDLASASLSLNVDMPEFPDMPELRVQAPSIPQPYCVEVWVEKSTMDDVLSPLCQEYGVNYSSGTGDTSITRCHDLIKRARSHGMPVRVLTITDFDPGGSNMPIGLARKLEFLIATMAPDLDVQVRPIALTREQVEQYDLPSIPIKESNRQASVFEKRHGVTGATELDALEALRPGELRQIVEAEIMRYVDLDLKDNVDAVRDEVQEHLDEINDVVHDEREDEIEELRCEHETLTEEMDAEVEQFQEAFEARFRGRLDGLMGRIRALTPKRLIWMQLSGPRPTRAMIMMIRYSTPGATTSSRWIATRGTSASGRSARRG